MPTRSRAREVAFQILYRDDLNPAADTAADRELLETRLDTPELKDFAKSLLAGVRSRRDALDEAIQSAARNWELHRMAATDRNVLRLGAFELLYADTPERVAIDEAVELAKRFGTAQSASFVNGILDHLMHKE
jgi:N utilization substance protein B